MAWDEGDGGAVGAPPRRAELAIVCPELEAGIRSGHDGEIRIGPVRIMITVPSHPVEDCGPQPVFIVAAIRAELERQHGTAEALSLDCGREQETRLAENRGTQKQWLAWEPIEIAEGNAIQPIARLAKSDEWPGVDEDQDRRRRIRVTMARRTLRRSRRS